MLAACLTVARAASSFPAALRSRNNIPAILIMKSAEDRPSNELAEPLKDSTERVIENLLSDYRIR